MKNLRNTIRQIIKEQRSYYGRMGSGFLFYCEEDQTVLLGKRSFGTTNPGSWGVIGGAIDPPRKALQIISSDEKEAFFKNITKEQILSSAEKEAKEECGRLPPSYGRQNIVEEIAYEDNNFKYISYIYKISYSDKDKWVIYPTDGENSYIEWISILDLKNQKYGLHFGVIDIFKKSNYLKNKTISSDPEFEKKSKEISDLYVPGGWVDPKKLFQRNHIPFSKANRPDPDIGYYAHMGQRLGDYYQNYIGGGDGIHPLAIGSFATPKKLSKEQLADAENVAKNLGADFYEPDTAIERELFHAIRTWHSKDEDDGSITKFVADKITDLTNKGQYTDVFVPYLKKAYRGMPLSRNQIISYFGIDLQEKWENRTSNKQISIVIDKPDFNLHHYEYENEHSHQLEGHVANKLSQSEMLELAKKSLKEFSSTANLNSISKVRSKEFISSIAAKYGDFPGHGPNGEYTMIRYAYKNKRNFTNFSKNIETAMSFSNYNKLHRGFLDPDYKYTGKERYPVIFEIDGADLDTTIVDLTKPPYSFGQGNFSEEEVYVFHEPIKVSKLYIRTVPSYR